MKITAEVDQKIQELIAAYKAFSESPDGEVELVDNPVETKMIRVSFKHPAPVSFELHFSQPQTEEGLYPVPGESTESYSYENVWVNVYTEKEVYTLHDSLAWDANPPFSFAPQIQELSRQADELFKGSKLDPEFFSVTPWH